MHYEYADAKCAALCIWQKAEKYVGRAVQTTEPKEEDFKMRARHTKEVLFYWFFFRDYIHMSQKHVCASP